MNYGVKGYGISGYSKLDSSTIDNFTFDMHGKFIFISESVSVVDLATMFSRWVDWYKIETNSKIEPAMRYSGYDPIPDGFTGTTYFMQNGWRVIYNPATTAISGVLYSTDFTTAYWDKYYNPIHPITVSAVVNTVYKEVGVSGLTGEESIRLFKTATKTDLIVVMESQ